MTIDSGTTRRVNVLVVDDDTDLQRVMIRFLTLEGFAPIIAGNGQEALTYLRGGASVDVILLDLRMPIMDGWTFRREQRADPALAAIPVVVLSGTETDRMAELAAAASFYKPVSFPEVIAVIRRLSGAHASQSGS